MESIDVEFQLHVDLQIYCCKFHNKEPKVKHTYLLTIPGKDDSAAFRINFDQTAEPNEETCNNLDESTVVYSHHHHQISHA